MRRLWSDHRRASIAIIGALGLLLGLALLVYQRIPVERRRTLSSTVQAPSPSGQTDTPVPVAASIRFTDVTAAAGLQFTHEAGATGQKWYPETIGAGAGFLDYDGDGWPDILLVNGTGLTSPPPPLGSATLPTLHLYRNRGDGTFEDVTQRAGVAVPVYGMGLAVGDYDNDGDVDVLITGYRQHVFFVNNGDGTFTDATQRVGIRNGEWGVGAAFFDYDRDGYLDLVISNYVEWSPALEQDLDCTYGTPAKDYCPVRYFKGQGLRLYHNRGDGSFEDVTDHAGVRAAGSRAFAPYIFDVDEDSWPDILVASDGTPSLLYRNRGDGTFEDVGVRSGIVMDSGGAAYAGMGIDATYPQNDEQLCIAIGNFVGEPTTLHCRVRQGESYHPQLYAEVSAWAGIGRPTLRSVTFGLFFFDADLDGFEDLFMVNGHVIDEARLRHTPRAQPPQLFRNLGTGKFAEVSPPAGSGLDTALVGRAAAYGDYDGDGDLDILISQNQGPALLLRNDTPRSGHYLRVRLRGTVSNRDGIGAVLRVHTSSGVHKQMARSGRSYLSQHEATLTFGLGSVTAIERVDITWPSGTLDAYQNVPADTTLQAVEGTHPDTFPKGPAEVASRRVAGDSPEASALPTTDARRAFQAHTQTGLQAYQAQRFTEATQAFETAIQLWPRDPLPYRYLADLYWRQGASEQAAQTVRALADVLPDAYYLDRVGGSFEEEGATGLALLFYENAARLDPAFPSARYNLGRSYLKRGDLEQGMQEVREALRLYPEFPQAHQTLGLAYVEQGRLERAVSHLEEALRLQPELTSARNDLARIYMAQGRLDDAIRTFETLLAQTPEVVEARHNLAIAYARKGLKEKALVEFRQALQTRPDFHAARIDMATLLLELQRPQAAIEALQQVLQQASVSRADASSLDPVDVRYRLGIAQIMAAQFDQAIDSFASVLQARPTHAGAHLALVRVYYQRRQFAQAWTHVRQAESLGAPVTELITALRRVSVEPQ